MISAQVVHACSAFLAHLLAPAARSLCLGCFAALAVAALRVKSVSGRLAVWKVVLYAALAMPLLGLILPPLSLELPAALARLIPRRATVANALHPSADTPMAGAFAPEAFPIAPFRMDSEIPLPKGDAEARRTGTARTSRSEVLPANRFISAKAAPVVRESDTSPAMPAKRGESSFPWIAFFSATYISIALVFLARLLLGIIFSRGLVRSARSIAESEVTDLLTIDEREHDSAGPLRLAESELISVPITLGILRPIILLPVGWREWGPAALRAVLAHERSHVTRHDALTQRLSLLHRALFWFSPLSWWLHGRLADAAEEASDEAALLSGADRAQYAETLLGFFVALQEAPRRAHWQGVSMAKAGQAEKRVDRILAWEGDGSMHLNKSLSISLLLLGIAAVFFAAAARPSIAHAQNQLVNPTPSPAAANPVPIVNPTPAAPPDPGVAPVEAPPALTLPEPAPPSVPLAVPVPEMIGPGAAALPAIALQWKNVMSDDQVRKIYRDTHDAMKRAELSGNGVQVAVELQLNQLQRDGVFRTGGYPMNWGAFDGGFRGRYVIVSGDSPILMSGDSEDVEHATSLRNKIKGDYIWFQHDEKNYVIRDQATVQRAKEIFKSEEELGQKQDALGKQQDALGDQQRELSKKMEAVRVQIPDMSADMQKLEAQMKQLSSGGTQQQLGDLQRQIGELQHKIGESQYQAGDQQRQIGEQMRELGQQQGELGRQQGQLGRQQAEASRQANEQMRQLLDDAVTRGTAQPE